MDIFNYRQKMEGLQAKIRQSEMARRELETKLHQMMRRQNERDKSKMRSLKDRYENFLEEEKLRLARNDQLLQTMEDIDYRAGTLAAKTERLKLLKSQYELYLTRTWSPTPAAAAAAYPHQHQIIMAESQSAGLASVAPAAARSIVYKCPSLVNANQQSNIQLPQYYRHSNIDSCSTAPFSQPQIILPRESYHQHYDPTARAIALGKPLTSAASCYPAPAPVQANNMGGLFHANNTRLLANQGILQMDKLTLEENPTLPSQYQSASLSVDELRPDSKSRYGTTTATNVVHVPNIIVSDSNVAGTTFRLSSSSPADAASINQSSWARSQGHFKDQLVGQRHYVDNDDGDGILREDLDKKRNTKIQLETFMSSGDPISTSLDDNYYSPRWPAAAPLSSSSQDVATRSTAVSLQGGIKDLKHVPGTSSNDIIPASYRYLSLERNSDQMPNDGIGSSRIGDNNQKSSLSTAAAALEQPTTNLTRVSDAELENYAEHLSGKITTTTTMSARNPNNNTTDHYFDDYVAQSIGEERHGLASRDKDIPVYSSSPFRGTTATPSNSIMDTHMKSSSQPPRNGEIVEAVHQKWEKIIEVDDKATGHPLRRRTNDDNVLVTGNTTAEQDQFDDREGGPIIDKWQIQQDQDEPLHGGYNIAAAVASKSAPLKDYPDYGRQPDTAAQKNREGTSTSEWEINSQSHTNYSSAPEMGQVKQAEEETYSQYNQDELATDRYPRQEQQRRQDVYGFNEEASSGGVITDQKYPTGGAIKNAHLQLHDVPEDPDEDDQFVERYTTGEKTDIGNEKEERTTYSAEEHSRNNYPHMETRTGNITSTIKGEGEGYLQQQYYTTDPPRSNSGSPTKAYEQPVRYSQSPVKRQQLSSENTAAGPLYSVQSPEELHYNQANRENQIIQANQQHQPLDRDQSYYGSQDTGAAQEIVNPVYTQQGSQDGDAQFNPEGSFAGEFQAQDMSTYQTPSDYPDTGAVDDYGGHYEESGYTPQVQSDYTNYLADATPGEYEANATDQNYIPMDASNSDYNDGTGGAYEYQSKPSTYESPEANYEGYYAGGDQSYGETPHHMENPVNYSPNHGNYLGENPSVEINPEQSYYSQGDQQQQQHLEYYPETAYPSDNIQSSPQTEMQQQPEYYYSEQQENISATPAVDKDVNSIKSSASLDTPSVDIDSSIAPTTTTTQQKEKDKPKRPVKKVQILESSTDSEAKPKRGPASTGGVLKGGKSKRADTSASDSSDFNFSSK